MNEAPTRLMRVQRLAAGAFGILLWLGFGGALAWALTWSIDEWNGGARPHLAQVGVVFSAAVLVLWGVSTRALFREVRIGVRERQGETEAPAHRRIGVALAPLAAPIIGMIIALIGTSGTHVAGTGQAPTAISATAPPHTKSAHNEATEHQRSVERIYVVQPGDRIRDLADRFYGNPNDWVLIANANKGRAEPHGARFVDPSVLRAGWSLRIPPSPHDTVQTSSDPSPTPATSGTEWTRDRELFGVAGFGLLGAALFAARQLRRRRYQRLHGRAGLSAPPLSESDAEMEIRIRPLAETELPEWIDVANRLLFAELVANRTIPPPCVHVMRAGPSGIELLVDPPAQNSPPSFLVLDGGHTWKLDPGLDLATLRDRVGRHNWCYLPALIPIGEDDESTYCIAVGPGEHLGISGTPAAIVDALGTLAVNLHHAPWAEVELYRIGSTTFAHADEMIEIDLAQVATVEPADDRDPLWREGSAEAQPILIVEVAQLASEVREHARGNLAVIGPFTDVDRMLYFEDGRVTIEPLGLNLRACCLSGEEVAQFDRIANNATDEPIPILEDLAALPSPTMELPIAGSVEIRLLRSTPDIVGDVADPVPRPALEFITYLAAHGGKATTGRLRDALGAYKRDTSRSSQTIWNAGVQARKAIGAARVPRAVNKDQYTLSEDVTCDWLRFEQMAKVARSAELIGDYGTAIEVLRVALELVEGAPGSEANHFPWLETEHFTYTIERAVVESAHRLFNLALAESSHQLAQWAIEQGRRVAYEDGELRRDAIKLATELGDAATSEAEYAAANEAIVDVGLNTGIDKETEELIMSLSRSVPRSPDTV